MHNRTITKLVIVALSILTGTSIALANTINTPVSFTNWVAGQKLTWYAQPNNGWSYPSYVKTSSGDEYVAKTEESNATTPASDTNGWQLVHSGPVIKNSAIDFSFGKQFTTGSINITMTNPAGAMTSFTATNGYKISPVQSGKYKLTVTGNSKIPKGYKLYVHPASFTLNPNSTENVNVSLNSVSPVTRYVSIKETPSAPNAKWYTGLNTVITNNSQWPVSSVQMTVKDGVLSQNSTGVLNNASTAGNTETGNVLGYKLNKPVMPGQTVSFNGGANLSGVSVIANSYTMSYNNLGKYWGYISIKTDFPGKTSTTDTASVKIDNTVYSLNINGTTLIPASVGTHTLTFSPLYLNAQQEDVPVTVTKNVTISNGKTVATPESYTTQPIPYTGANFDMGQNFPSQLIPGTAVVALSKNISTTDQFGPGQNRIGVPKNADCTVTFKVDNGYYATPRTVDFVNGKSVNVKPDPATGVINVTYKKINSMTVGYLQGTTKIEMQKAVEEGYNTLYLAFGYISNSTTVSPTTSNGYNVTLKDYNNVATNIQLFRNDLAIARADGLKNVLLSFGGSSAGPFTKLISMNPEGLAKAMLHSCQYYGINGVDFDIESNFTLWNPLANYGPANNPSEYKGNNFSALAYYLHLYASQYGFTAQHPFIVSIAPQLATEAVGLRLVPPNSGSNICQKLFQPAFNQGTVNYIFVQDYNEGSQMVPYKGAEYDQFSPMFIPASFYYIKNKILPKNSTAQIIIGEPANKSGVSASSLYAVMPYMTALKAIQNQTFALFGVKNYGGVGNWCLLADSTMNYDFAKNVFYTNAG
ncbi:MAG: hypothetical protein GY756_01715 [bacterium]|nr:hypothetical protein [bacterium]